MKAAVLNNVGEELLVCDVPDPVPGAGEAVVKVTAAALNRRDWWIREGKYPGLKFPITLGSDAVGVVSSVGSGVWGEWVGKRVIINPSLNWGENEEHQDPQRFEILGLPTNGTLAEYVKIPAENLCDGPNLLSDHEAAAIPLAGVTAYRAIAHRGKLNSGEKVLVTGVGSGAAVFALQFADALGGEVYVTSGHPDKIEKAKTLGALDGENYREVGWAERLKAKAGGFDLIVDSAGGAGFEDLIDLVNPGGRIVFFGATAGMPPKLPSAKVFYKQISLLGTTMGSPSDFAAMVNMFEIYKIRPLIDQVLPLEDANAAISALDSSSRMGKVVVQVA
jgi:NADPH:quinone reductase-like Zn-dependent oxidoreductase